MLDGPLQTTQSQLTSVRYPSVNLVPHYVEIRKVSNI